MDWTVIAAIVGLASTVTTALGSLLLKAYIEPVKKQTNLNEVTMEKQGERIRHLEQQAATHSTHLENLMKAVDRLVNKIDELVSYEKQSRQKE